MKRKASATVDQEPMGIVISRGASHEDLPPVFTYVWGPAPQSADEPHDTKAA